MLFVRDVNFMEIAFMRLQKYMYVCLNELCKGVLGLETFMDYFAHPEVAVKKNAGQTA